MTTGYRCMKTTYYSNKHRRMTNLRNDTKVPKGSWHGLDWVWIWSREFKSCLALLVHHIRWHEASQPVLNGCESTKCRNQVKWAFYFSTPSHLPCHWTAQFIFCLINVGTQTYEGPETCLTTGTRVTTDHESSNKSSCTASYINSRARLISQGAVTVYALYDNRQKQNYQIFRWISPALVCSRFFPILFGRQNPRPWCLPQVGSTLYLHHIPAICIPTLNLVTPQ